MANLSRRLRALGELALKCREAAQRAQTAAQLDARTNEIVKWTEVLGNVAKVRTALELETYTGTNLPMTSDGSSAVEALRTYREEMAAPAGASLLQDKWKSVSQRVKKHTTNASGWVVGNLTARREAGLARISPEQLRSLGGTPGFGDAVMTISSLRGQVERFSPQAWTCASVASFVASVEQYYGALGKLDELGPKPPPSVQLFCAKARSAGGIGIEEYTDEIRDWFVTTSNVKRLTIRMQ